MYTKAIQTIIIHIGVCTMKYLRQLLIILLFSFLGELLKTMLPLPVPASIYGLLLLFAALEIGVVKLAAVQETGRFLIEIMPVMFIPAGVGLIDSWDALKPICIPVTVIMVVSTVIVMVVSGRVTQYAIRKKRPGRELGERTTRKGES